MILPWRRLGILTGGWLSDGRICVNRQAPGRKGCNGGGTQKQIPSGLWNGVSSSSGTPLFPADILVLDVLFLPLIFSFPGGVRGNNLVPSRVQVVIKVHGKMESKDYWVQCLAWWLACGSDTCIALNPSSAADPSFLLLSMRDSKLKSLDPCHPSVWDSWRSCCSWLWHDLAPAALGLWGVNQWMEVLCLCTCLWISALKKF